MKKIVDYQLTKGLISLDLVLIMKQLGYLLQVKGQIEESFHYLKKGLAYCEKEECEKEVIELHLLIGKGYYYLNNISESLAYYQKAMEAAGKRGEEIKIGDPYFLMGSVYWFSSDLKKSLEYQNKAILYFHENDWDNKLPAYAIRAATYIVMGNIKEAFLDVDYMEKNLKKTHNTIILPQIYHVCSLCYSWGGKDAEKAMNYTMQAYDLAIQSNNIVFQYSVLFSRTLAYFYQKKYNLALDTINLCYSVSEKNNIFIGIFMIHGYEAEIYLWKKDFTKANEIALKYLKQKNEIIEKIALLLFLKSRAVYLYYIDSINDCLDILDEAEEIFKETDIMIIGVFILLFKAHVHKEIGNYEEAERIKNSLQKKLIEKEGIEYLLKEAKELIDTIEDEKKGSITYSSTSTSLKEKLQLDNIIRTSHIISSILNIDELLIAIMEKTLEVTGAERGALLLFNKKTGEYEYKIIKDIDVDSIDFKVSDSIIQKVAASKKGVVMTDYEENGHDTSQSMIAQNIKSIICAPLIFREEIIGLLYLDSKLLTNLFSDKDLEFLKVFTTQAAIAIDNAKMHAEMVQKARLSKEIEIARDIQMSILPQIQDIDCYQISTFMKPATEIGGDFFDFYLKDEPYIGMFGDVAGHGIQSGLIMMMTEISFNSFMNDQNIRTSSLTSIYDKINLTLYDSIHNRLCKRSKMRDYVFMNSTLKLFRFDKKGSLEIFGCDHAEPFICRNETGSIEIIQSTGYLLGISSDAVLDHKPLQFQLHEGDILIFYSDGIIEARNKAKKAIEKGKLFESMFGKKRLYDIVVNNRNKHPNDIIKSVILAANQWMVEQHDDITMVVMKKIN